MSDSDWVPVIMPCIVLMQGLACALAWKRHMRFAGYALAASPALLLYIMALNHFEGMSGNGLWFDLAVLVVHVFPLLAGLALLAGARLHAAVFWVAWILNVVPLAFFIFMTCCFHLEF